MCSYKRLISRSQTISSGLLSSLVYEIKFSFNELRCRIHYEESVARQQAKVFDEGNRKGNINLT